MATNYAVRITRAWADVERAVVALALRCDKVLAYEHVGTATEKVHVHLMLVGVRCDTDTLKNDCKRNGLATLKGNADWTFKTKDKKYGDVEDSPHYICYMTKGKHDPKYNKGYTQEELDDAKSKWTNKPKSKQVMEYELFEVLVPKDLPTDKVMRIVGLKTVEEYTGFNKVRDMAYAYSMEKCGVLGNAAKAMCQMLYKTYCYKHHIVMDPKFEGW